MRSVWNVLVTAADAQVGDADVSGRPGEGVITLVIGDTRPFRVVERPYARI